VVLANVVVSLDFGYAFVYRCVARVLGSAGCGRPDRVFQVLVSVEWIRLVKTMRESDGAVLRGWPTGPSVACASLVFSCVDLVRLEGGLNGDVGMIDCGGH